MEALNHLKDAVLNGEYTKAGPLTEQALKGGTEPGTILNQGLIAAMDKVGGLFKEGEIYVPEVLLAAKAMQAGMAVLKPELVKSGIESRGKVVVGTVRGDLHDIGKNLVAMMLEGAGFEIIDLGNDVPAEEFVEAAEKNGARVIGMSALLTTTMHVMKETIELLRQKNLDGKVRTMVGGAPVTSSFANEIGADGYGDDAATAVDIAKGFLSKQGR
jgi:5-methyltetrahydrofolate--homocysteine methyltransferase